MKTGSLYWVILFPSSIICIIWKIYKGPPLSTYDLQHEVVKRQPKVDLNKLMVFQIYL